MRRLIIRPGAIGDFLVSLPAMESLRADYTEIWTAGANVPLAGLADRARSIVAAGLDRLGIVEADDVIEELRRFDSIVSWYGTNRPEFRALTGSLGLPFSFYKALPEANGHLHAVDFFLGQMRCPPGGIPRVLVPAVERRDFAVLHPFSGSPKKNWPLDRFRELAARLESSMPVLWCRGPDDDLPGAIAISNLHELACLLSAARVFVGNDSGITHLAAAVETPVVALFGPSDPGVWAPRGAAVQVISLARMNDIPIEAVLAAIR